MFTDGWRNREMDRETDAGHIVIKKITFSSGELKSG